MKTLVACMTLIIGAVLASDANAQCSTSGSSGCNVGASRGCNVAPSVTRATAKNLDQVSLNNLKVFKPEASSRVVAKKPIRKVEKVAEEVVVKQELRVSDQSLLSLNAPKIQSNIVEGKVNYLFADNK